MLTSDMARPGCTALFVVAALAACSAAPSPQASPLLELEKLAQPAWNYPAADHPPASRLTLAEQAAASGLVGRQGRRGTAKPAADSELGAQKYPFGLANPFSPERSREPKRDALTPVGKDAARADDDVTDATRLPTDVVPVRYTITMAPQIDMKTFYASTDIYLNVAKATSRILLNSADLTLQSVQIFRYNAEFDKYYGYGDASLTPVSFSDKLERIVVELSRELVAGEHYLLRFPFFTGDLREDLKGFYLSKYKDFAGRTRRLATTQFESTAARYAFPCFDEPALKARFKIIIEHDSEYGAVSNMPAIRQTKPTLSTIRTEFDETLPMSTYLLAWVVSDFEAVVNDDLTFNTWGRSNAVNEKSANLSQTVGPAALRKLKDFTGIPYALPKVDQFAIPDFEAGAMENWGLVTYREEYLLETIKTTIRIREYIATTVCHELGHQWTGNLVTLDWWSNTWLNEGFATYFENVICDQILPEWKLMDKYVTDNVHVAIANDVIPGQVAMTSPVFTKEAIEAKFGRISYKKGGSVLRMFEYILGTEVWKKGLNRYLSVNAYKNGSPDRLFKALNAEAVVGASPLPQGVSFGEMAKKWTEQAGVPVVTAVRDYQKSAVTITQEQFFYGEDGAETNSWFIPIPAEVNPKSQHEWLLQDAPETKRWLTPDVPSMVREVNAAASEWIILNPKQIGYYLVNYDEQNWKMLQAAWEDNPTAFHASTRTMLLHDALALARGGRLSYDIALPLLKVLKNEPEAAPWRAGIEALSFLNDRLANTPAGFAVQELIKSITSDAFNKLGFSADASGATNQDEERYLRYYVVSYACNAGNAMCIQEAVKRLEAHLNGGMELDADVRDAAMCAGVRNSPALFEKVLRKWTAAWGEDGEDEDEQDRVAYAGALGCTKDHGLLGSILDDILNKKLAMSPDALKEIINQIMTRMDNHKFMIQYYKTNWEKILRFIPDDFYFNLLTALIKDVRTEQEYNEVETIVKSILPESSSRREEAEQRLAAAKKELGWYKTHFAKVSQWMYTETKTGPVDPTEPPAPSPATSTPRPPSPGPGPGPTPGPSPGSSPGTDPTPTTPKSGATEVASTITLLLVALMVTMTTQ